MDFHHIKVETFSFPSFCDDFDPDCVEEVTPTKAKTIKPPLFVDEDSGLGLEYDAKDKHTCYTASHEESPSKQDATSPFSYSIKRIFSRRKRCLRDGDENGSITKKRRNKSVNRSRFSKSLSFQDNVNSEQEADVSAVVEKFVAEENLIGNGTRSFCLPTVPGRHSDLKSIMPATLADILTGRYDDVINSYRVIDCRYPYEYNGGHIKGAENRYNQEQIIELLENSADICREEKRNILIFHCEFSSERGPKMCRLLRNRDREINKEQYPHLNFPEIYLLHDGYKAFFEFNKELCEPMTYKPMLDSNHSEELRHFRAKSKSWCNGQKRRKRCHRLMF